MPSPFDFPANNLSNPIGIEFYSNTGNNFGYQCTTGDFNSDSFLDIVISANFDNSSLGRATIFYGPYPNSGNILQGDGDFSVTEIYGHDQSLDCQLGRTIDGGDVNGDGVDDLLVGGQCIHTYLIYGMLPSLSPTPSVASSAAYSPSRSPSKSRFPSASPTSSPASSISEAGALPSPPIDRNKNPSKDKAHKTRQPSQQPKNPKRSPSPTSQTQNSLSSTVAAPIATLVLVLMSHLHLLFHIGH